MSKLNLEAIEYEANGKGGCVYTITKATIGPNVGKWRAGRHRSGSCGMDVLETSGWHNCGPYATNHAWFNSLEEIVQRIEDLEE